MSGDGYVLIRRSTLAWLLERHRAAGEVSDVPEEVARDLRDAVTGDLLAPEPEERLRALGPVLSAEQHVELIRDSDLGLPRGDAGEFWRIVVNVVHAMMISEAEAVLRLIGGQEDER